MKSILEFIDDFDNFLVFGHEDPDADSICSQIVISMFLKSLGKKASVYAQLPFNRIELKPFESYCRASFSSDDIPSGSEGKTAVFLVDCSTPERTGPFSAPAAMFPRAIIDHHDSSDLGSCQACLTEKTAPSTTYLVYLFLKDCGYRPDIFESSLLFLGLCTDTGFFRHLGENSGSALKIAGELCDLGASPNEAFYSIYGNRSIESRRFLGLMLSRAQTLFSGKLLTVYEKLSDLEFFSPVDRDKDMLYQLLLGTSGVTIVASFKEEEKDRKCSVSLRTREEIDLNEIAGHFGGGGHKKASGYTVMKGIDEAMQDFISYSGAILI